MKRLLSSTGAHVLDADSLADHIDVLFRVAWALCGSRHDAEDLVQETFVKVLKRPRLVRGDTDIGYLVRALKNTHASWYRGTARQRSERPLLDEDGSEPAASTVSTVSSRELMEAIASAPEPYRDAVIAVDLIGLSYREAARSLRIAEGTVTSRLHRGRQHVARLLTEELAAC
jgi:RNA polymerase sigma-70 factor (ECF subfamily)